MIVLELFGGTRSIGKAFERRGHKVFTVEWDKSFDNISLYADVGTLTADQIIKLCGGATKCYMGVARLYYLFYRGD